MVEEPQTFNVKELTESMKCIEERLDKMEMPEGSGKPRGFTEETHGSKPNDTVRAASISVYKEWLVKAVKNGSGGDGGFILSESKKFTEAIGQQTSGSAIPMIWSAEPEILSPEGADGYFLQKGDNSPVQWKEDVKGKPGNVVYVQTISPAVGATVTSGTEPTFTASTLTSVPVTLTQLGYGFFITKADVEDIIDGTIDKLIQVSKMGVMRAVDAYFLSSIQASANNAAAGTVTEAGGMAATTLAKMWGSLMAGSYKPGLTALHPVQYASLLRDPQFVYAYAFGASQVLLTGQIPKYLGMDIVPLVQGTLAAGGGTYRAFMMAKGALVGAIKRELEVEKEYYVKDQKNYVNTTVRFGGTPVHVNGIGLILTVGG